MPYIEHLGMSKQKVGNIYKMDPSLEKKMFFQLGVFQSRMGPVIFSKGCVKGIFQDSYPSWWLNQPI